MFAGYLLRNRRRYWFGIWHDDNDRSGARRRVFFMIKFAVLFLKSAKFHKRPLHKAMAAGAGCVFLSWQVGLVDRVISDLTVIRSSCNLEHKLSSASSLTSFFMSVSKKASEKKKFWDSNHGLKI